MDVHRAPADRVEEPSRDHLSIRRPHEQLRSERQHLRELRTREAFGLEHREGEVARASLHRRARERPAVARPIRLRHHGDELHEAGVAMAIHRLERRKSELGRAEEEGAWA